MRPSLARLIAVVVSAVSFSNATLAATPTRPNPVGLSLATYQDTARRNWTDTGARPLGTAVWYPAAAGSHEADWTVAIFNAGSNAQNAPMAAAPSKLPLVVLSHGTGGGGATLGWLAETLAANGYIVAAVNHHGNTGAEPAYRLEGFLAWWDRPRDMSVLIDKLLADPRFGARIDAARIGVAGFSLGGYTALASVGARLNREQWLAFCAEAADDPSCKLPPEIASKYTNADAVHLLEHDERLKKEAQHMGDSFRDPRIRSAFAIAPVLGPALVRDSLAGIDVPVHIVVGTADDQAVPTTTAKPVAAAIPKAELDLLPQVTHYTFLATCTLLGRNVARPVCVDPEGVDREAVHRRVAQDALDFFNRTLR